MTQIDHIQGHTYHGRKGAIENAFRYSIDYVLTDMPDTPKGPGLFSRNRWNLASLHDSDHGGPPKEGRGVDWVYDVLESVGIRKPARVALLSQPRFWGHVFNPVSFWLCFDAQDGLMVVIAEVTNTFNERHSYLCVKDDLSPIRADDVLTAQKIFYVSPFQPIEGGYEFRFDITPDRIGIWIDYSHGKGGLIATLVGPRKRMTNLSLIIASLRRPLGSWRVQALIFWQAFKLWRKGATYRVRPAPPEQEVSHKDWQAERRDDLAG